MGGHDGGFFARGIGDDLLDILITTLRRLPMRVTERLGDLVYVELVKESLMCVLVRLCGERRHDEGQGSYSKLETSRKW